MRSECEPEQALIENSAEKDTGSNDEGELYLVELVEECETRTQYILYPGQDIRGGWAYPSPAQKEAPESKLGYESTS